MATAYSVLGQSNPSAATLTTLYTVPASTSAVGSTISICNIGESTTYRIAIRPAGATIANQHYIAYNALIGNNESIFLTLGITLETTDVVSVYAGTANVSFNLFGSEIT